MCSASATLKPRFKARHTCNICRNLPPGPQSCHTCATIEPPQRMAPGGSRSGQQAPRPLPRTDLTMCMPVVINRSSRGPATTLTTSSKR
jgi:hypothetical protein